MRQPEPWVYEEIRQQEGEEWARKTRPFCNVCDEPIQDERCYILDLDDPFEGCICKRCMMEELETMKKAKINTFLREAIAEMLEYGHESLTPHK
jgi:hypothetical protein